MLANIAWRNRLRDLLMTGTSVAPRGQLCLENLHATISVDIEHALVTDSRRHLNYKFAAAEALWIIKGDNKLQQLAIYNKRMAEFSDDGVTLAGAYGPRIACQTDYVVNVIKKDRQTRQASISIWTPNPVPSKDIPCTLALNFMIRDERLHCHVFMRSSDVWLGVPYDLFSFSQLALIIAARVKAKPGYLWLTAASSHLYDVNAEDAQLIANHPFEEQGSLPRLPYDFNEVDVHNRLNKMCELGRSMIQYHEEKS